MKQQTAVEWLKEKVKETYDKEGKLPIGYILNLIAQAKAIEAEQIINAFHNGQDNIDSDGCIIYDDGAEQYYNETYSKQEIEKI